MSSPSGSFIEIFHSENAGEPTDAGSAWPIGRVKCFIEARQASISDSGQPVPSQDIGKNTDADDIPVTASIILNRGLAEHLGRSINTLR